MRFQLPIKGVCCGVKEKRGLNSVCIFMSATRENADSYCHLKHPEKYQIVIPFLKIYIALAVLMKYQTPVIPATGVRLMTLSLKVAT